MLGGQIAKSELRARRAEGRHMDKCQVIEATSVATVPCNQPAVATVVDSIKSYRLCDRHAKEMENAAGPHTVTRD